MTASITSRTSPIITEPFEVSGGQRVLIVDSDASSRSILEVSLKRAGFDVTVADNGREALSLLGGNHALPAVVVLSSDLHGEDGYSLCAQLRSDPKTAKVPVLMLARSDDDEGATLAGVAQVDELVAKPAFARDVAALVTLWISERDAQGNYLLDTRELPLPVTLRALLSTQRSGQILLGKKTFVAYRAGRITHAETDGISGSDALVRVLTLAAGPYRVSFTMPTKPSTLEVPLRELVNGIFPRLQKWEALAARSVPIDAQFQVDFTALAKALPTIPDAVNEVVRLFDGQRTVRQVLFDSPLNETVTLEVANRLLLMGVVQEVAPHEDELDLKAAPRLFEPRETEAEERMSTLFGAPADLADAIVTPTETPVVKAGDWWEPPKGSGLEMANPTDGWVQQQLSAFNIQSVIEPSEPARPSAEVKAFNDGAPGETQTPMEIAMEPIRLMDVLPAAPAPTAAVVTRNLEDQFFSEDDEPTVRAATSFEDTLPRSVSDAMLGPIEDTYVPGLEKDEPGEDKPASKWLVLTVAVVLVVALLGVLTWRFSGEEEGVTQPDPVPMIVAEPETVTQPAVVHLEAETQVPAVSVSDDAINAALLEATKQYESGQVGEAIATLEQIVEVAPSRTSAWMQLAMARFDNSERGAAEEAAQTVLALDPNHADAFMLLAAIHQQAGKIDVAVGEMERYLELEPNGANARDAKALLRKLKKQQ